MGQMALHRASDLVTAVALCPETCFVVSPLPDVSFYFYFSRGSMHATKILLVVYVPPPP